MTVEKDIVVEDLIHIQKIFAVVCALEDYADVVGQNPPSKESLYNENINVYASGLPRYKNKITIGGLFCDAADHPEKVGAIIKALTLAADELATYMAHQAQELRTPS